MKIGKLDVQRREKEQGKGGTVAGKFGKMGRRDTEILQVRRKGVRENNMSDGGMG